VESPHELALLDLAAQAAGRRADVLLRVNLPGQEEQAALVMGGKPSPFGMDVELLRRCTPFPVRPSGWLRGLLAAAGRRLRLARLRAGLARLARPGETLRIEPGCAVTAYSTVIGG
jgi:hypothetical protein